MIYATDLDGQIAIGSMAKRITIRTESAPVLNDLGETESVTVSDQLVWSYIDDRPRDESDLLNKETVVDMKTVIIRYKGVTVTNKVLIDGDVYDVLSVRDLGRKRFDVLTLKKVN